MVVGAMIMIFEEEMEEEGEDDDFENHNSVDEYDHDSSDMNVADGDNDQWDMYKTEMIWQSICFRSWVLQISRCY